MITAAVLVAAGDGRRLGHGVPKAFVRVAGRTLLEHAASRFADHPAVRDVVVVAPAALVESARELVTATVVPGGRTRQQSVARGLAATAEDVDLVLVHDVARAFVPAAVLTRVVDALRAGADAAIPVLPVVDTIKQVDAGDVVVATLRREQLRVVQTPQGFRRELLLRAHAAPGGGDAPDDAALVEALGARVVVVDGSDESFKITRPRDLALAELHLS